VSLFTLLGCTAYMQCIDAAYCYRCCTQRGLCVCLCKNSGTDQGAVWRADLCGSKEPFVRWQLRSRKGPAIFGLSGLPQTTGSLCCSVHSKREPSILNNGMTAAADCNAPNWSVSNYIVPRKKSATLLQCGRVSKFFDLLLIMAHAAFND